MMKRTLNPGTLLCPVPAVMVSCGREGEKPNILTIAWTGIINSDPRDVDKFKAQNLTAADSVIVGCPSIEESPVNIECRVRDVLELGSHDMFIAEIVSVSVDEKIIDDKGEVHLEKADLIAYSHGHYHPLKRTEIGRFGYSVMKPKTRRRYEAEKRGRYRTAKRNLSKGKGSKSRAAKGK